MTTTSSRARLRSSASRARRGTRVAAFAGTAVLFAVVGLVGSGSSAQASSSCSAQNDRYGQSQVSCNVDSGPRTNSVRWQ
jgi:hypothetical protein